MQLPLAALTALAMLLPAAAGDKNAHLAPAPGPFPTLTLVRDSGQWADTPAGVRQWFQSLMQPDNPSVSCCGEADAFEADTFEVEGDHYVAVITDGKGMVANGTRVPVPNSKMKWDAGNPTGHGILFLQVGTLNVYCYVAPGGV
jgi:hypothetical protein